MNRKSVGLVLMVLSFLYFVAAVWGGYRYRGIEAAVINAIGLVSFIGGVWCLAATKREGLGLGLMVLPFLLNVAGIWGGYQVGSALGGEFDAIGGAVFNAVPLGIFVTGVWCLFKTGSDTKEA
ncbi:MAG: hypothetical protein OXQ92_15480 [Boseongicola sp.]|nr:hypothetical protein [Boseongicola sp.]